MQCIAQLSRHSHFKSQHSESARLQADLALLLYTSIDNNLDYTMEEILRDITDAIRLFGYTSSQASRMRRKKILKAVNPNIQDLAEQKTDPSRATPFLFGEGSKKKNEGQGRVPQDSSEGKVL